MMVVCQWGEGASGGAAIEEVIRRRNYTCYACAICSNHVHLVIRTHRDKALTMWNNFAEAIRERLRLCFGGLRGEISVHHPVVFARPYKVFLFTPEEVWGRIAYVEGNPEKEGLARQRWAFVTAYDGWPRHRRG